MTKGKPRAYNRRMPDKPPKAFQSALWPHLEEIRSLRRARKMWPEIAEHLHQKHGIRMTYRAIRNFFVRATNPNRRIPIGMEEHVGAPPRQPVPAGPAQPAAAHQAPARPSYPSPAEAAFTEPEPDDPAPVKTRKLKELREQREREQRTQKQ